MIPQTVLDQLPPAIEGEQSDGSVAILNVSHGDFKLSFNSDNPEDVEKARRTVTDMLRKGYVLTAEVDGQTRRIETFDPKTDTYTVSDTPQEKHRRILARRARKVTAMAPTAGG